MTELIPILTCIDRRKNVLESSRCALSIGPIDRLF